MLVTEEQAKELWCPETRVGEQASGAAENRPDGSHNCIASHCMFWQWADRDAGFSEKDWGKGYCGRAGKP